MTKAGPGPAWVRRMSARMRAKLEGPFLEEVSAIRDAVREGDLSKAVMTEDADRVIEVSEVKRVGSVVGQLGEPIEDAVQEGGRLAMAEVKAPAVALDMQRPRVRRWMERHTGTLIKQVNGTSVKAIRAILKDGYAAGRHPRAMARDIRAVVGLTEPQSIAVARRRQAMVEAGVPEATIEKRMSRYAERLLKQRAETIARTESMTAINQGRVAMWQQLAEDGALDEDTKRQWLTADDERVCPICGPLDEHPPIPLDGSYQTSIGTVDHPPAHPSCRCTEIIAT